MDAVPPRKDPPPSRERDGSTSLVKRARTLSASPEIPLEVRDALLRELASLKPGDSSKYLTVLTDLPWTAPTEGWRTLDTVTRVLAHEVRRHAGAHAARDRFLSHAALRAYRDRPGTVRRTERYIESVFEGLDPLRPEVLEHLRRTAPHRSRTDAARGASRTRNALLLVGPPGVGKTRIAERMASAAGTGFAKVSLAGHRDADTLRGFARTYVGAAPSQITTALRRAGRRDAVLLLDEIDKTGTRFSGGSPADVLLEVLDGRSEFRDAYLDVPLPLSDVFWIATANDVDLVPEPLLDRLDVVEVGGYTRAERESIVLEDLWPQALVDNQVVPIRRSGAGTAGADRVVLTPAAARLLSAGTGTRDDEGLRETERRLSRLVARLTHLSADRLDEVLEDLRLPALVVDDDTVLEYLPELSRHRADVRRRQVGFGPNRVPGPRP